MIKLFFLSCCISWALSSCNLSAPDKSQIVIGPGENIAPAPEVIERWQAHEYRNQNWQPEDGRYFFSESWTWSYWNETLSPEDPHYSGEFTVYVDPPSGTFLLTREASNYQDEMTLWVIIKPNGSYIQHWIDHDGSKKYDYSNVSDIEDHEYRNKDQKEDFKQYFEPQDEYRIYGKNEEGRPDFASNIYRQTYAMTDDTSIVSTTVLPFEVQAFHLVEKISGDINLPIDFKSYAYLLPVKELLLEENYNAYGKRVGFQFKSIYPTEYFIEIE